MLNLAVCDFSLSSTQVCINDTDFNVADWGLFKQDEK